MMRAASCSNQNAAKPNQLRAMSDVEAAWVGAFIEADGYAGLIRYYERGHGQFYKRLRPRIDVTAKNPEDISTLLRLTGTGSVTMRPPTESALGKGPYLKWSIGSNATAIALASRCAPYSPKLAALVCGA